MCVMLQAVQGLHAQGRAHCDVNPSNIQVLLSKEGHVLQCTLHGLAGSVVHEGMLKHKADMLGFPCQLSLHHLSATCKQQCSGL